MKRETRTDYERAVLRALSLLADNLDAAVDLGELAKAVGLSSFHFHRIFRGMVGETPVELHRRLRLERAAWCLTRDETPVTTIAFSAGYETHESFTRAFRRRYACTPTQFRRRFVPGAAIGFDDPRIALASPSGIHFRLPQIEISAAVFIERERSMQVEIKQMPEMRVATIRHVGPYDRIGEVFSRLGQLAAQASLFGPESNMVAIYHDDPETTPVEELRSDAGLVVSANARLPAELTEQTIQAGPHAVTTHVGSYRQLGEIWTRFMGGWLARSEHRIGEGVCYEIYRNQPGQTAEKDLITELYVPVLG